MRVQRSLGAAAIFTSQDVDVRAHRGAYLGTVGIGREEGRGNARAVIWSACVGRASPAFNEAYHGARVAALDFVAAGLGLTCPLGARGYVRPHVDFSDVLSPSLRPLLRHPSVLAAGLATGVDF